MITIEHTHQQVRVVIAITWIDSLITVQTTEREARHYRMTAHLQWTLTRLAVINIIVI